jgi:malonate decarboxylase alpha subunit
MSQQIEEHGTRSWTMRRDEKRRRMQLIEPWMKGPVLPTAKILDALENLIVPGEKIVLEGNNQKQADFLSRTLVKIDPVKVYDLHLIISSISRTEHLTLFELGIAR